MVLSCPNVLSTPTSLATMHVAALALQLGPGVVEDGVIGVTGLGGEPDDHRRLPLPARPTRPARTSGLRTSSIVGALVSSSGSSPPKVFLILASE